MCLSRVSTCGDQERKYHFCVDSTQMSANLKKTLGANPACWHHPEHKWLGTQSCPVTSSMLPQEGCDRTRLLSESEGDPEKSGLQTSFLAAGLHSLPPRGSATSMVIPVILLFFHSSYLICIL